MKSFQYKSPERHAVPPQHCDPLCAFSHYISTRLNCDLRYHSIFKKKKIKPRKAHAILNFTKIQNQVLLSVETKTL